jgi:hypothetical protein
MLEKCQLLMLCVMARVVRVLLRGMWKVSFVMMAGKPDVDGCGVYDGDEEGAHSCATGAGTAATRAVAERLTNWMELTCRGRREGREAGSS